MARGGGKGLTLVVGIAVVALGISVLMVATLTSHDTVPGVGETPAEKTSTPAAPNRATTPVAPPEPRRLRVAGSEGHTVVLNPDGSSYLEDPEGKQTQLTEPGRADEDAARTIETKLEGARPRKTGLGLLVVTDTGVVDVPKNAVITFIGRDKVVTHDPDGTSRVYFVDGRVVSQARGDRGGRTP